MEYKAPLPKSVVATFFNCVNGGAKPRRG